MKLSVIIPVFNEEKTVAEVIKRVKKLNINDVDVEIIVIDDGSTDKTVSKVEDLKQKIKFKFIKHIKNSGKGAAVCTGINNAIGEYVIIQDADLEYDPNDIPRLFSYIKASRDVIYGTRLNRLPNLKMDESTPLFLLHYFGNRFLSLLTSLLYGQWITDMETCYKLFPRNALKDISLRSKGFDFEPEITAKLLKKGLKIKEVPIKTTPRGYEDGKKLNTFRDGSIALWTLLKYKFTD